MAAFVTTQNSVGSTTLDLGLCCGCKFRWIKCRSNPMRNARGGSVNVSSPLIFSRSGSHSMGCLFSVLLVVLVFLCSGGMFVSSFCVSFFTLCLLRGVFCLFVFGFPCPFVVLFFVLRFGSQEFCFVFQFFRFPWFGPQETCFVVASSVSLFGSQEACFIFLFLFSMIWHPRGILHLCVFCFPRFGPQEPGKRSAPSSCFGFPHWDSRGVPDFCFCWCCNVWLQCVLPPCCFSSLI